MADPIHGPTSSNTYLNAIEWGGWKWDGDGADGTNIAYYFDPGGADVSYLLGQDAGTTTSVAFMDYEKDAYRSAANEWAKVADISFTEVFSYMNADLVEHKHADAGSTLLGVHETPASASGLDSTAWGTYNSQGSGWSQSGLQKGGYGYITLVHEIGHGLGLAHPHDISGGNSTLFPGVTNGDSSDLGDHDLNQGIFTIMSYNDGWNKLGPSPSDDYGWQSGPMAFDIAAIQDLYGAKPAATGNTTYKLGHVDGSPDDFVCIWDTGGTDKLKYKGDYDAVIDLRAATLENEKGGGGYVSYVKGAPESSMDHWNAYTIANGVVIEKAKGGKGDDKMIGNDADNTLVANKGDDKMKGMAGDDVLRGGKGKDKQFGGADSDTFTFKSIKESKDGSKRDKIVDFQRGDDVIDLKSIDAKKGSGNQKFEWIGDDKFHDKKGELRIKDKGSKVIVQGDVKGDGHADFEIFVKVGNLHDDDFVL